VPDPAERDRLNPYHSPTQGSRPVVSLESFRDRRTALAVFGVLEILFGLFLAGIALLIPVSQSLASRTMNQEASLSRTIPSMLVYVMLAGVMIGLGVGSMRARRWARNLMLVVAWAWLVSGVLSVLGLAWLLPGLLSQLGPSEGLPQGSLTVVLGILLVILSFFMILIPAVLVAFYRSANVRATCEAFDPEPDWTEACPLPVLTVSLWLMVSALFLIATPMAVNGTMPLFGGFASGLGGTLLYWVVAGLWGYGAYGLYKLRTSSWWLIFASTVVLALSYIVTFALVDPMAMYERMGYSAAELAAMKQFSFTGPQLVVWLLLFFVPYLGYLVYLRKYLSAETQAAR
jgi:hypothetical protein